MSDNYRTSTMVPLAPPPQIWAIHGQLQTSGVWHPFITSLGDWFCEDLRRKHWAGFDDWINDISEKIAQTPGYPHQKRVLVGYSMGGRLAMMLLIKHPQLFQQVIIISADPGIDIDDRRDEQAEKDREWASAFIELPWSEVIEKWHQQPVFSHENKNTKPAIPGLATEQDKAHIANWFAVFGKAKQANLCEDLPHLGIPITYIYGKADTKYQGIADQLVRQCPDINCIGIADSGHRVPWENPVAFNAVLQEIIGINS